MSPLLGFFLKFFLFSVVTVEEVSACDYLEPAKDHDAL
jgi:hypothetical protein